MAGIDKDATTDGGGAVEPGFELVFGDAAAEPEEPAEPEPEAVPTDPFADEEPPAVEAVTLDACAGLRQAAAEDGARATAIANVDPAVLSEAQRRQVEAFVGKIDVTDTASVLSYGVGVQKKMTDFSSKALEKVQTSNLGEIGGDLSKLVVQLGQVGGDKEERKGLFGLFKRGRDKAGELKAAYDDVEANVEAISDKLLGHQRQLLKDIDMFDQLYQLNEAYFKELTMYILAGKEKLDQVRSTDLVALQNHARETGSAQDAQRANDLAAACDRFEKRVYDLLLTREVSLQMAPQIRMLQSSDTTMAQQIQTTIVNSIPLWKNQLVISLGLENATQAAAAERQVTDMTNALLRKNADALKQATVATAKESERGIVDMETLRHTNEQLISTLDEVMAIQREGKEKRRAAEQELAQIEDQLKRKLLEASGQ